MRIEFYGVLSEVTGTTEMELFVEGSATVEEVLERLGASHPELAPHLPRVAVAVGDTLVRREASVDAEATLALLPPVSGGV